jgi:hypothetical protein
VLRFLGTTLQVATQAACTHYQQPFEKGIKDMKAKLFLILMLNCFFCLPAISQVTIIGRSDCGQWVANSKSNFSLRAWLLGYMSGINYVFSDSKNNPLGKTNSAEQIYLWMDNYCAKNPLMNVSDGGNELFLELSKK